ncbi:MAG: hypothetical protein AB7G21_03370 [Dehalococcoidia bacterium]
MLHTSFAAAGLIAVALISGLFDRDQRGHPAQMLVLTPAHALPMDAPAACRIAASAVAERLRAPHWWPGTCEGDEAFPTLQSTRPDGTTAWLTRGEVEVMGRSGSPERGSWLVEVVHLGAGAHSVRIVELEVR